MKYFNKTFSVFINSPQKDVCDNCGLEAKYYIQTKEGKFCQECYGEKKKEKVSVETDTRKYPSYYYDPPITMRGLGDTGHPCEW